MENDHNCECSVCAERYAANIKLGWWLAAALEDPKVCEEMKANIREWFKTFEVKENLK